MLVEQANASKKYNASDRRSGKSDEADPEWLSKLAKVNKTGSTNSKQTPSLVKKGLMKNDTKETSQNPFEGDSLIIF